MSTHTRPWRRLLLLTAGFLLALPLPAAAAVDEADLLPVDQAFALSAHAEDVKQIRLDWAIADGYYLYKHRIKVVAADAGKLGAPVLPRGEPHDDEFFGKVETYRGHLRASVPVLSRQGDSIALKVSYQGCADAGVCYPPQTRVVRVPLSGGAVVGATEVATGHAGASVATSVAPTKAGPINADTGFAALGNKLGDGGIVPLGGAADSASDKLPLPPAQAFAFDAIAGDGNTLLLRFTPARGYYLYRDKTRLKLTADGIKPGVPRWPVGVNHHDEHFGDVVVYFDQVEVPVPLQRSVAAARQASLTVSFQGCQDDGICYPPMTRTVSLAIPAGTVQPAEVVDNTMVDGDAVATQSAVEPTIATSNADATQTTPPAGSVQDNVARTLPPADVLQKQQRDTPGLLLALLLALGGGVVLNLMPCVLPVLTLKALSLAASHHRARSHALWYTAGVLCSFVAIGAIVLALREAGRALGWGFQLQQPLVIGVLVYVMFAVGLSLSGVFSIGHKLAGAGQGLASRSGPAGDFFTGVLAVIVASPCTAPFMAAALAFAFAAPAGVALLVFAALGVGLALPFLLIGFVPALARRLPQPGGWMEALKQFLAFPMYLTAVWLLWVLGKQRGMDAAALALIGLVLLALAAWWLERLRLRAAPLRRALAVLVLLLSLVPLAMVARLPAPQPVAVASGEAAVPYSAAKLAALRQQGRVVFVDMTADWCVTCKANEKAVLSREAFRTAMGEADAVFMQGDWTNVDPEIGRFLEAHNAVGVPLYVVFPRNGGEGEVLPTVLTVGIVEDALQRAAR